MQINRFEFDVIDSNMYIIVDNDTAIIIDPNANIRARELLDSANVKNVFIILTHEHFDHISGVNYYRGYNTTVCSNFDCKEIIESHFREILIQFASMFIEEKTNKRNSILNLIKSATPIIIDKVLNEKEILYIGTHKFCIKETPGHSKGSICVVLDDSCIFTGDSLLPDYEIETRFQGGSINDYKNITLPFLKGLNKDLVVYPGHGKAILLGKALEEKK